jgi:GNAT superfamily N-acetyltransferase
VSHALGGVTCRAMHLPDLAAGLELCRASHWNQMRHDWECFLNLNPNGCRVAVREDRVVGTVVALRYPDRDGKNGFGWIAMVLVDPEERRRGIGSLLMREALDCLSDQAMIRLDATPAGHAVYKKLGFIDEYKLIRMEASSAICQVYGNCGPTRLMVEADLPRVLEMDHRIFGADRGRLLRWMFHGAREYARVVVRDREIIGYIFGRHGFRYEHLGPVVADDCAAAEQLLVASLSGHQGNALILDAPCHDHYWTQLLESIGFKELRSFIRMYRGENLNPGIPDKQFAILGPEFG